MLTAWLLLQAYELSTLTGTQVMLLVASETGHVYTFATRKLQPMITSEAGKALIQTCLNSPDPCPSGGGSGGDQRMSATGFEETELSYNIGDDEQKVRQLVYGHGGSPHTAHAHGHGHAASHAQQHMMGGMYPHQQHNPGSPHGHQHHMASASPSPAHLLPCPSPQPLVYQQQCPSPSPSSVQHAQHGYSLANSLPHPHPHSHMAHPQR